MVLYCAANTVQSVLCAEKLHAAFNVVQFNLCELNCVLSAHKSKVMQFYKTKPRSKPQLLLPIIT